MQLVGSGRSEHNLNRIMDPTELNEVLLASAQYLRSLKQLDDNIKTAVLQIESSSLQTEDNINNMFATFCQSVLNSLNARRGQLLRQIETIKEKSLKPLNECQNVIAGKIASIDKLVTIGKKQIVCDEELEEFSMISNSLGNLPEVPELKEVPSLSFQCDTTLCTDFMDRIGAFGYVSSIAPVQISLMTEKPGSILVCWQSVENDERTTDIQEFRLQNAVGNTLATNRTTPYNNYRDCYTGPDYQFLVKNIQPNQPYTFRVCCKFEGSNSWSPWSLPQISQTTILPYSWSENEHFDLRHEDRIAKICKYPSSVLFSKGPQFHVGYSIEFTILECDSNNLGGNYIGLALTNKIDSLDGLISQSFLVEATGDIYVDGTKKSTKLPEIVLASKICFTCEQLNDSKILINIDSRDKRVTYDWFLNSEDVMYFFAYFNSTKWKIMVE